MRGAERALADFGFNGWGGKYVMPGDSDLGARLAVGTGLPTATQHWVFEGGAVDTDGTGLFVTTEQCRSTPIAIRRWNGRRSKHCWPAHWALPDDMAG